MASVQPNLVGALLLALSSAPILVIAVLVARGNLSLVNGLDASRLRDPAATATRLSRWLGAMGVAMLAGAGALLLAGHGETRVLWITLACVAAVNAIAVGLVFAVVRARRDYRPLPTDRDGRRIR